MKPTREESLFALALETPAKKRAAFLDLMCDGDSALRASASTRYSPRMNNP